MATIKRILFREINRPLRTTFATSLGKKALLRSVYVTVILSDGSKGTGEIPTSHAIPYETIETISATLGAVTPALRGMTIGDWKNRTGKLRRRNPRCPMTISGLEVALFRAFLASENKTEHGYWGGAHSTIETDITVPFVPEGRAVNRWIRAAAEKGFRKFKIKLSGRVTEDIPFLAYVYDILHDAVPFPVVRIDGNQGFTVTAYFTLTDYLEKKGIAIELFEQPLRKTDFTGMKDVCERSPVPVILDETVLSPGDLDRVIGERLAHGVNIKIAKSGIVGSGEIYDRAKAAGLKVMVGCMIETMTGLSAGIHFAAGREGYDLVDLDAIHFLHHRNKPGDIAVNGPFYHI